VTHGNPDRVIAPIGDAPSVACRPFVGGSIFQDEMVVIAHIAAGYTDEEIGELIDATIGQVRWTARSVMAKLGARNRPHAVSRAIALGYLELRT
jgi:DNA-binding CsgD family transcriptional regulator